MASLRYDLIDLRLFISIAEAGNLTRGAEHVHLSVGAASMRVKGLEEALGAPLFIRSSLGVRLTPAGDALLVHARRVFRDLERLHGDMQIFSQGLKGRVRIFANTTAIAEILPAALGSFLAAHPQVDIELEERLSPEIARAVADGTVDIGILAGSIRTDELEVIPYQQDRLVMAVTADHPFVGRDRIDFSEAAGQSFVSLQRGSAIHGFMENIVAELGVSLDTRIQVSGFDTMCRMVEAGVGVGILPGSVARRMKRSHAIHVVELSNEWAVRELKICVRRLEELPSFARELIRHLVAGPSQTD
ncbi:LysR family transcriptional regulator [Mesorhizobium sp. 1B3]|uniref:LysR family transcriptional regulator n=1 Tax=Mesorhizobium sp. 1B3 TaxID=3243599 RepID=UPI003D973BE3